MVVFTRGAARGRRRDASERGRLHVELRSRIAFPFHDGDAGILGFAGQATHSGPSWPEWLTSPERGRFRRDRALFGLNRAAQALAGAGRATVTRDCLEVLRLHQAGRLGAVAVIRVDITPSHLARLAAIIGTAPERLVVERATPPCGTRPGFVVRPGTPAELAAADRDPGRSGPPAATASRRTCTSVVPDADRPLTARGRLMLYGLSLAIGLALPIAWLLAIGEPAGAHGQQTGFMIAVGAVTATYAALTLVAAAVSGRVRARSRARRMRAPWERGGTEWQPVAWTYHHFEEILVGAALVSILACLILFFAIGGVTG